ncbi:unnamed protein product [Choristocarpus tenellus]
MKVLSLSAILGVQAGFVSALVPTRTLGSRKTPGGGHLSIPQTRTLSRPLQFGSVLHSTVLPQHDSEPAERLAGVEAQKENYKWTHEVNPAGSPYLDGFDFSLEGPSLSWAVKLAGVTLRILLGGFRAQFGIDEIIKALTGQSDHLHFFRELAQSIKFNNDNDWADTVAEDIDDFMDLFEFPNLKPKSVIDHDDDLAFARLRLQGPNPVVICPCNDEVFNKLSQTLAQKQYAELKKKLEAAMSKKTLYAVDWSLWDGQKEGTIIGINGEVETKCVNPTIGLFELNPDNEFRELQPLLPVAIQCGVAKDGEPLPPIMTPDDGWAWQIAKLCYHSCDGMWHEGICHLGQTHLTVEPFLVATNRHFSNRHPIYKLLKPHLEGTAFINHSASNSLIEKDGSVDDMFSADVVALHPTITSEVIKRLSKDFSLPADLEERQMDAKSFPYPYRYRDDAMPIWEATLEWVTGYLEIYYGSSKEVQDEEMGGDHELKNWVEDMVDNGRSAWLAEFDTTDNKLAFLSKVIASVIYTASTLHAAVNFPQKPIMAFVPAYPLGLMKPSPTEAKKVRKDDYVSYLPRIENAKEQLFVGKLLGGVHHTRHGLPRVWSNTSLLSYYEADAFDDDRVKPLLQKLSDFLEDHEDDIEDKNGDVVSAWKSRGMDKKAAKNFAYKTLLPRDIPQSINI